MADPKSLIGALQTVAVYIFLLLSTFKFSVFAVEINLICRWGWVWEEWRLSMEASRCSEGQPTLSCPTSELQRSSKSCPSLCMSFEKRQTCQTLPMAPVSKFWAVFSINDFYWWPQKLYSPIVKSNSACDIHKYMFPKRHNISEQINRVLYWPHKCGSSR